MHAIRRSLALALLVAVAACSDDSSDSDTPPPPPPPTPEPTTLQPFEDPPGVRVTILGVAGASGADGTFRPGDHPRVTFELEKADGSRWGIAEMVRSSAMVSGPSFNYQRVIAEQTDVVAAAVANSDGSFTYAFGPIPAHYLPPYNDTPSFDDFHGELAGDDLLAGTYTAGLSFTWDYVVEGASYHDVGEATFDFLFGGATMLAHREVTKLDNCNQCHSELRAHQGLRRTVAMCVLCHTSGAEDLNDPLVAGGTPATSIDFKVMNHKIHNAKHLPSVVGIGIQPDGKLDYTATPRAYVLADSVGGARDYSNTGFPVWPNRTYPMPRDIGYHLLGAAEQAKEDLVRTGITACVVCHGDPDGAGPLTEPAQGDVIYAQPTRHACQACHDDVDFFQPYDVNNSGGSPMPEWPMNADCFQCHPPGGTGDPLQFSPLSLVDGHTHPLRDPKLMGVTFVDFTLFKGLNLAISNVVEAGASDGDGTFDPGEKVQLSLTLKDDLGANFPLAKLGALTALINGPSENSNLVLESSIPRALLSGPQPFTIRLPELIQLEFVGRATAAPDEVFTTARAPHLDVTGAKTSVLVRMPSSGGASVLLARAEPPQNYIDVASTAGFARNDFVVLGDGTASEEYLRIQYVEGDRLWFSSAETPSYKAGTQFVHALGSPVAEVALTTLATNAFALDAVAGTVTEVNEFGDGNAVLVTYTTDFVVPARYPLTHNDSPDLDETVGEWRGKPLVDGTYRVQLDAYTDLAYEQQAGEVNPYRYAAPSNAVDVLVGSAMTPQPYALISSADNCNACHQQLDFHGATYRGFDACIACHGNAGGEDRPRYVAANAPDTFGVTVNFRTLLHQVHRGSQLANANTFQVVGAGPAAYPDNFEARQYDEIVFPALPGRTATCAKCHGSANTAWIEPAPRDHPTDQILPSRPWRATCAACHDTAAAAAHFDLNTTLGGVESCAVCHGPGAQLDVELAHKAR
jgi:hypothetical protein